MAGNTFVVDGGGLQPGVELLRPGRDVPPHAAGPGEVLTGTGVVDPAGAGGGDAALQAAQRRRDVEVDISELVDRGVGELLHPGLTRDGSARSASFAAAMERTPPVPW